MTGPQPPKSALSGSAAEPAETDQSAAEPAENGANDAPGAVVAGSEEHAKTPRPKAAAAPEDTESSSPTASPEAEETPDPAPETDLPPASLPEAQAPDEASSDPEPEAAHEQPVATTAPPPRRGGAAAMVLGGAVAAGLGFGAALLAFPEGTAGPETRRALLAQMGTIQDRLAQTAETVAALKPLADDLSQLSARLEALAEAVVQTEARLDAAGAQRAELQVAITELRADLEARAPTPETAGDAAAAAMEQMLAGPAAEALARLQAAAEGADARLDAIEAERAALAAERQAIADRFAREAAAAEAAARAARIAAARLDLEAALASGAAFEDVLSRLVAEGISPDPGLTDAAAGVPTEAALRTAFPPAARAALRASLSLDPEAGLADRALTFLRLQTGARALAPREGDDPDAILSRAEAALSRGDLPAALAEVGSLPPEAAAEMAPWRTEAERRAAALRAFAALPAPPAQ